MSWCLRVALGTVILLVCVAGKPNADRRHRLEKVDATLSFLVSVNDSWGDCIATVKTLPINSDTPLNKSDRIQVGNCDSGPLVFQVTKDSKNTYVHITFHSSVIEDASPPECTITWNYSYLTPKNEGSMDSLLPGCFVEDSREGYHMTYYWFYIHSWP